MKHAFNALLDIGVADVQFMLQRQYKYTWQNINHVNIDLKMLTNNRNIDILVKLLPYNQEQEILTL